MVLKTLLVYSIGMRDYGGKRMTMRHDGGGDVFVQVAGLCGFISLGVIVIAVLVPLFFSPWFHVGMFLSDLGVFSDIGWFFSLGLVVAGFLFLVFSLGVIRFVSDDLKGAGFAFALASCGLILAGVNPDGVVHIVAVGVMLLSLAGGLVIFSLSSRWGELSEVSRVALVLGVLACVILVWFFLFALAELVVLVCVSGVCLVLGGRMLFNGKHIFPGHLSKS